MNPKLSLSVVQALLRAQLKYLTLTAVLVNLLQLSAIATIKPCTKAHYDSLSLNISKFFEEVPDTIFTYEDSCSVFRAMSRARILISLGRHAEARSILEEISTLDKRLKPVRVEIDYNHFYGSLLTDAGELERAEAHLRSALIGAFYIRDHSVFNRILIDIGRLAMYRGEYAIAASCFYKTLREAEKYGLDMAASISLGNLAAISDNIGDFDRGFELLQRQAEYLGNLDSRVEIAMNLGNQAVNRMRRGYFDSETLELWLRCEEILRHEKNFRLLAWSLNCKGHLLIEMNRLDNATEAIEEAYEIESANNNGLEMMRICTNLAALERRLKNFDEALSFIKEAKLFGAEVGIWSEIVQVLETEVLIYRDLGDVDAVYAKMDRLLELQDSIARQGHMAEVTSIEALYQNEKLQVEKLALNLELGHERFNRLLLTLIICALVALGILVFSMFRKAYLRSRIELEEERGRLSRAEHEISRLERINGVSLDALNQRLKGTYITVGEFQVILELLKSDGQSTIPQIAENLNMSSSAIKSRLKRIKEKLHLGSSSKEGIMSQIRSLLEEEA